MDSYFIHEKAHCETRDLGPGTRIWAFAQVLKGAKIGSNCNICGFSFIENDVVLGNNVTIKNGVSVWDKVRLEDDVFVGPNAVFTNDLRPRAFIKRGSGNWLSTIVKRGATIGANATVVCGTTLGEYCMIGAGAVVIKDVPAHALVVGNPARVIAKVCFCGEPLKDDFCTACKKPLSELDAQTCRRIHEA